MGSTRENFPLMLSFSFFRLCFVCFVFVFVCAFLLAFSDFFGTLLFNACFAGT